jgi:hypothetical protein
MWPLPAIATNVDHPWRWSCPSVDRRDQICGFFASTHCAARMAYLPQNGDRHVYKQTGLKLPEI